MPYAPASEAPRAAYVDYLLRFVIDRSSRVATDTGIAGRLDALERTLVTLTRPWRAESPLRPARELRASSETLDTLFAWVEGDERAEARDVERLGIYASGAVEDVSVPEGWVRIRLAS